MKQKMDKHSEIQEIIRDSLIFVIVVCVQAKNLVAHKRSDIVLMQRRKEHKTPSPLS